MVKMEPGNINSYKWHNSFTYIAYGHQYPDSEYVKLYNTTQKNLACMSHAVPNLSEGSNQTQYKYIVKFWDDIPIKGKISLTICVKDLEKNQIKDRVIADVSRKSKNIYIIDAYYDPGEESSNVQLYVNNGRYNLPSGIEGHYVYDFEESTVELSIFGSDFKIKQKLNKYSRENTLVLFNLFNNSQSPITFAVYKE